jgi:hypothetical protein
MHIFVQSLQNAHKAPEIIADAGAGLNRIDAPKILFSCAPVQFGVQTICVQSFVLCR